MTSHGISSSGLSADLQRYLQQSRDAVLRALDGLGDATWWADYVGRIQAAAERHRSA